MKTNQFYHRVLWLLLPLLILFNVNAWGTTVTTTFTNKSWADSNSAWTSNTAGSDFDSSEDARGVANKNVNGECTSKSSYTGVYSIYVVASANSGGGAVTVKIGSTTIATKSVAQDTKNASFRFSVEDYDNMERLSGNIKIVVTKPTSTSKTLWVKSITINYATTTYTVTYNAGSGSCLTSTQTESGNGYGVTLPSASPSASCASDGWVFAGWKRTSALTETTTIPDLYPAGKEYHPSGNETLYAVYRLGTVYSVDFESAANSYTGLTFTNMVSQQSGAIDYHGGVYYGSTNAKSTASIATSSKINPKKIRFYVSKTTSNTSSSTWAVQTSTDGSTWTDRATQSAVSMTPNNWVEVSQDLSSYSNVFVRVYYGSNTATRAIDDLTISCATYNSNPSCSSCSDLDPLNGSRFLRAPRQVLRCSGTR